MHNVSVCSSASRFLANDPDGWWAPSFTYRIVPNEADSRASWFDIHADPIERRSSMALRASEKSEVYIGKGRFVKDDPSKYPDKELFGMTGGWAGGQVGLMKFIEETEKKGGSSTSLSKESKKKSSSKGSNIDLSKDFGGLAGGFPGGEKGVKIYVSTGKAPEKIKPTIGPVVTSILILLSFYGLGKWTESPYGQPVVQKLVDSTYNEDGSLAIFNPENAETLKLALYASFAVIVPVSAVQGAKFVLKSAAEALNKVLVTSLFAAGTAFAFYFVVTH